MVSRKDYIAIAGIVRECTTQNFSSVEMYQAMLVSRLVAYMQRDNALFNSHKFRSACYGKGESNETGKRA